MSLWCHGQGRHVWLCLVICVCGVMAMCVWRHGHVCGDMAMYVVSWPCLWCHGHGHVCGVMAKASMSGKVSLTSQADLFLHFIGEEQTIMAAPEELRMESERYSCAVSIGGTRAQSLQVEVCAHVLHF